MKNFPLNQVLKNGLNKIYGWTSADDGIRHALMDDPASSFAESYLMLVLCSAFVNYLKSKIR